MHTVLYHLCKTIGFDLDERLYDADNRPTDTVLETAFDIVSSRISAILTAASDLYNKLQSAPSARDLRAPKDNEENGHPLMRPVVQKAVFRAVREVVTQRLLTWDEAISRLQQFEWRIGIAPWTAVFNPSSKKMLTGKDSNELLLALLKVHLAPTSKNEIKRARKQYKEIRGVAYPVPEDELLKNLPSVEEE